MAHSLNPTDAYALINLLVKEATGQDNEIQAVDSSSFVSVGERILATGTENTLNALSRVLGRTFMAVRPYNAPLMLINSENSGLYTDRMRKISFYSREAQASGAFNTDIHIQHAPNLDNGTNDNISGTTANTGLGTMWEQNPPVPLEVNFASRDVWDDSTTIYEVQLQNAFRSEANFSAFMAGVMTEKGNDIESQKEAFNRMTLLNFMAGVYDLANGDANDKRLIDLKAGFNAKYGTNYTTAQLLSTYLEEFLKYFVAVYKTVSDYLTIRSNQFHWSPEKVVNDVSYTLLRHTPKDRQRAFLYAPLFIDAEAQVMSGIFNPEYLDIGRYEKVTHWQNINNPMAIDVTPAIPDTSNPNGVQVTGQRVRLSNVVGMIFDTDAVMVDYQLDRSYSTPVEARKAYRNIWWHFSKGAINDFTENAVVFYLGEDD